MGKLFKSKAMSSETSIENLSFDFNTIPSNFSLRDLDQIIDYLDKSILLIKHTDSPRTIALESWLIVDYVVRHSILDGLDLLRHGSDDYDVHEHLLPKSHEECLKILESLLDDQRKSLPDPTPPRLNMPGELIEYLIAHEKDLFKKLLKIDRKTATSKYPDLDYDSPLMRGYSRLATKLPIRTVSEEWLKALKHVDKKWFDNARRLNTTRNKAAHTFDEKSIYLSFGINGKNKVELLRAKCIDLLEAISGIKVK